MPKLSNKYYRRAKANTDALINSIKSNQDFDHRLKINNDVNINEQLNCIELNCNNFNNNEFDNNMLESLDSNNDTCDDDLINDNDFNNDLKKIIISDDDISESEAVDLVSDEKSSLILEQKHHSYFFSEIFQKKSSSFFEQEHYSYSITASSSSVSSCLSLNEH